jgi:hypothetical protein
MEGRLPHLRHTVVWLFVFCIIPLTAPFAALIGGFWYWSNRTDVRALPSLTLALARIALWVAVGQTLLMFTGVMVFTAWRA